MKTLRNPVVVCAVAALAWLLLLTGSVTASAHASAPGAVQAEKTAKSASGKVVGVTPTSLSVEVHESGQAKTLDFIIDSSTTVEGKVAKDARVQVTYRIEEGRNIATLVRVLA
jgi:hypothetical protein